MAELSIEEQEFNLDKRIALFENTLSMQVLRMKYDTAKVFNNITSQGFIMASMVLINQRLSIVSQVRPKYPKGGIIIESGSEEFIIPIKGRIKAFKQVHEVISKIQKNNASDSSNGNSYAYGGDC